MIKIFNKPTNPTNLGISNQRLVLNAIIENEAISRAQLARLLSMSKPSIADNVTKLINIGLIVELGEDGSNDVIGRRGTLLGFNKNHKYIIAIDFYYDKTVFTTANLIGEIVNEIIVKQNPHQNFESWLTMSINSIKTLLTKESLTYDSLAAIGICSPGIIDNEKDTIVKSPIYGTFDPIKLKATLIDVFNCPVYLSNATNASTLGEWFAGAANGFDNVLYVSCGVGLGAGIIINNKLYEGNQYAAGEIANFIYPSILDNEKTLEDRIGISSLIESIEKDAPNNIKSSLKKNNYSLADINSYAIEKEKSIVSILRRIAKELGVLVCNLVMILNCDIVVMGGEYTIFHDIFIPTIQNMVNKYCIIPSHVTSSLLGDKGTNLGIASICREYYFTELIGV